MGDNTNKICNQSTEYNCNDTCVTIFMSKINHPQNEDQKTHFNNQLTNDIYNDYSLTTVPDFIRDINNHLIPTTKLTKIINSALVKYIDDASNKLQRVSKVFTNNYIKKEVLYNKYKTVLINPVLDNNNKITGYEQDPSLNSVVFKRQIDKLEYYTVMLTNNNSNFRVTNPLNLTLSGEGDDYFSRFLLTFSITQNKLDFVVLDGSIGFFESKNPTELSFENDIKVDVDSPDIKKKSSFACNDLYNKSYRYNREPYTYFFINNSFINNNLQDGQNDIIRAAMPVKNDEIENLNNFKENPDPSFSDIVINLQYHPSTDEYFKYGYVTSLTYYLQRQDTHEEHLNKRDKVDNTQLTVGLSVGIGLPVLLVICFAIFIKYETVIEREMRTFMKDIRMFKKRYE